MKTLSSAILLASWPEFNLPKRGMKMLQNIDYTVRDVADDFSNHLWFCASIRNTYVLMKSRNDYSNPHGGVLMWSIIFIGYYLSVLPLIISIPIVIAGVYVYHYFDFLLFQDREPIRFEKHNDVIICTGAHGYERRRLRKICSKRKVKVKFEKACWNNIQLKRRNYYRRYYY